MIDPQLLKTNIEAIEENLRKRDLDIDLDKFRSYQYAVLTQGVPFVSLPGANLGQLAFIRSAQIYDSANPVRYYLYQKDVTFMNEYWPNRDNTSK